jgi:cephalosporin hydroxylase
VNNTEINQAIQQAHAFGMIQNEVEVRQFLDWYARLDVNRLLEIGTHTGGFLYLLMRVGNVHPRDVISVDLPWQESEYAVGNFRGKYPEVLFLVGNSHDETTLSQVRARLGGQRLDFLFLDGDHSFAGVGNDFVRYSELVRPGGWVGFHDINNGHECGDFYWERAVQARPHVEFGYGHTFGIGCVQV